MESLSFARATKLEVNLRPPPAGQSSGRGQARGAKGTRGHKRVLERGGGMAAAKPDGHILVLGNTDDFGGEFCSGELQKLLAYRQ